MPLKVREHEEPTLNLTPMIDVVFLLIIFFMVGARFTELEREFDINLPTVSEARPLTNPPDRIEVNVFRNGRIKVAGQFLTIDELNVRLQQAQQRYADQAVMIRADGNNAYQKVIDVLSVCEQAQIKHFTLAARVEGEEPQ